MKAAERKQVRAAVMREFELLHRDWFDFTEPKETQAERVAYARELLTKAIEVVRKAAKHG